ncbi:GNAT family N-acetyltransferase [Flavobacterium sp. MK4S-17]|uniref:GNAT family N-acetyltransferase n=1 Tax=Flavobacterium sp. MK4S-17 TaxID=2543737 RepID=UPI00135A749F|nr:GNAT family N-acetyltransferase [Flavobacterium sp. MK4S-17]
MNPEFKIKRFNELSLQELYKVLQLRSEVFVVEQNCVYQDVDGKDEKALHLLGIYDNEIFGYSRLFAPGYYFDDASIGRVAIAMKFRNRKWGHSLIQAAIQGIYSNFGKVPITISAQLYLKNFYESHGFVQQGEVYPEDGIPHIQMHKTP